ncbi:MAG: metallophosphoesterase, partial [Bacteroidota bacterium]
VNGKEAATQTLGKTALQWSDVPQVEVAGYFEWEPKMEVHNLLKAARIYDQPLNKEQINSRFKALQTQVEAGHLFAETFHFTAGPYLHYATTQSINLLWETDRPATAEIRYGTSLPLTEKRTLDDPAFIQEITLEGLEAGRPYYYEIETNSQDGQKMSSGLLTFSPAPDTRAAISFCIIGDTESRPHINHRLGEMIWEERPNFVMHLGDVTDGGMEDHKFEWTYEYFTGITPLASRIPIFTVPGNGEKDLYWYKKYHRLPGEEAFYKFRYGDAEFFMLNSNANEELVEGGKQYDWLKKALAQSTATWKFVAHHHCPYSSDENDFGDTWAGKSSSQSDPKFGDLKKLYQSAGVDVVFYGHVHAFERSWPLTDGQVDTENGVVYIKSGGAGGHLEDFSPTPTWFSQKVQRGHHYCKVDIYRGKFVFRMYDLEGRLKDFWEWDK